MPLPESLGPNSSLDDMKFENRELYKNLLLYSASSSDPELQQLADSESIPRLTALSEHVGFVPPDSVKVRAECHDTGMNITFLLNPPDEKYTGAVYAAERFEQCRVFVRS
ncbi:hypothetical protein GCK32_014953, partial [Trichostrongylus colubriformis]